MSAAVNIHEAKASLSSLVARAERGEEVFIARRGVPVARLVALARDVDEALARFDALRALDRGSARTLAEIDAAIAEGRP
jgi:prevent-host-death family protein